MTFQFLLESKGYTGGEKAKTNKQKHTYTAQMVRRGVYPCTVRVGEKKV